MLAPKQERSTAFRARKAGALFLALVGLVLVFAFAAQHARQEKDGMAILNAVEQVEEDEDDAVNWDDFDMEADIAGGKIVKKLTAFPFVARVWMRPDDKSCTGVILSPKIILTAAHCLVDYKPDEIEVAVGLVKFAGSKYVQSRKSAAKLYIHPDYHKKYVDGEGYGYDLGIIKLKKGFKMTKAVQSLKFLSAGVPISKKSRRFYRAVGWGKPGTGAKFSKNLKWAYVSEDKTCSFRKRNLICVKGKTGAPCKGDSGGPLLSVFRGKWLLVGILSYGKTADCGTKIWKGDRNTYQGTSKHAVWKWIYSINSGKKTPLRVNSRKKCYKYVSCRFIRYRYRRRCRMIRTRCR